MPAEHGEYIYVVGDEGRARQVQLVWVIYICVCGAVDN